MASANCPSCRRELEVEDAYRDWTVRCPHCGHEFVPSEEDRPRRRPRRDGDDEDDREREGRAREDEEREERDRRDRDDRDYEDRGARVPASVREAALREVAGPALWLEICGWLTALSSIALFLLGAALAMNAANNPPPAKGKGDDEIGEVFMVLGCCMGMVGVPYGVLMAIGARHLRNLSNRGWALTSAILAVAAFSVSPYCGIIHAGIGAWALVAMDKRVVREAFGLPVRRSRRRRRDYDDY